MARIKINLPEEFPFCTTLKIRITDINYGGHVGNDSLLSLIHEARLQFLQSHGFTEMNLAGCGLIMSDAGIEFKAELFYGDEVKVQVAAADFTKVAFAIYYKLEKQQGDQTVLVCAAKTGMVCYDYTAKKIAPVPAEAIQQLTG